MNATDRVREYWRDVRRRETELRHKSGDAVYLALLDGNGKLVRVVVADPYVAARGIVDRTHRLATPAEIDDYIGADKAAETQLRAAELSRDNKAFVLPRNAA